jgi:hypothetical protein
MGKNHDPGSGMNIPDNISESLETIFGLKYKNSLMRMRIRYPGIFSTLDPGWKKVESGINIPDPHSATLSVIRTH